ncbi:MAG: choice-of-anchor L domain-containing protein [Saprospiraceae bacterium]|nr:choice-of-anchor L domain-containing protein [Saprospiraceae bacterium]
MLTKKNHNVSFLNYIKFTLIGLLFCLYSNNSYSQLIVNNTMTPAQLVQNILVGQGITVSNVTYSGALSAIGSFSTGATPTNIGFPSGVILASGNVTTAIGPNTLTSAGNNLNQPGDSLLSVASGYNTYDAAILEFDFVPVSDTIKFRYVFASEEYPEYSGSTVNDVFGFFVSGLNPLGGNYNKKNIAIIPGTANTPVSINTLNNGLSNTGPCNNCAYYIDNTSGLTIQYDAFTTVLTAWIRVMPCFTYHIKIAISDAGDGIYDSGVFLEANSFMSSSVVVSSSYSMPNVNSSMAIEGCNDAILTLKIPQAKSTNTIINYAIWGTAINGVDYTTIPNNVTIPAGQDSVNLIISPILDGIVEGIEQVILLVNTSACTYDTVYIDIMDNSVLESTISNDTVICKDSAMLVVNGQGALSPYTYLWSNGDTLNSTNVSPASTTQYFVTITDICLAQKTDSVLVKVSKPVVNTTNDSVCYGNTGTISANAVGGVAYLWNNGSTQPTISDAPGVTTQYTVTVTDTLGCTGVANADIEVYPLPVVVLTNDTTICDGETIDITASGGIAYLWNTGDISQTISLSPSSTATYSVSITDNNGCENSASMEIVINPVPIASISAEADTICKGGSTILYGSGGDSYIWSTGSTASSITVGPKESTSYTLTVANSKNGVVCTDVTSFDLGVKRCNAYFIPNAFTPNGDGLNDVFGPVGVFKAIDFFEMYIYDRWGRLIYFTKDLNEMWDGTVEGGDNSKFQGVYTYKIIIQETYAERFEFLGTVILIP